MEMKQNCSDVSCLWGFAGWEEGEKTRGASDGDGVVEGRRNSAEQVEAQEDGHGEEQSVVVEDGEDGGLEVSDLVLLPQDSFVLLLARHLVISQQLCHLASHGVFALDGDLVLQSKFGVSVGHRHQVRAQCGEDDEEDERWQQLHLVDAPV